MSSRRAIKDAFVKWKPQIFRLSFEGPVRFNGLLRQLEGSNKQSVAVALRRVGRTRNFLV